MKLKDFTEKEQEMIRLGLSTSEISDKETAAKILGLVPQEWIKRIPFFVRKHATTRTISVFLSNIQISTQLPREVVRFLRRNEKNCAKSLQIFSKKK